MRRPVRRLLVGSASANDFIPVMLHAREAQTLR
jgi:hypothetical protein